jgi:hypothetical protein
MGPHYHPLENCLVRIFYSDESRKKISCGTGVALSDGRILTCAHVIKEALQLKGDLANMPEQHISLDFPFSSLKRTITTRIIFWDVDSDIAGLAALEELPAEVIPASLYVADNLWGHRIQAFGFPDRYPAGTWADSELRGPNIDGWIEIVDPQSTGYYVQQGFSGGPVWDADLGGCIGIVVAADKNSALRTSYLIPAHMIAEKWNIITVLRKAHPRQKRELPPLLAYRINRATQAEDLRKLFRKNDRQKPLPMIGIIHGDEQQAHDMFLARLANEIVPDVLSINSSQTPVIRVQLPWPTHLQKIGDLGEVMARELSNQILHLHDASSEDVQRTLVSYNSPVIIEMELLTDDWMKHKKGILEAILEFWNTWPPLVPHQDLFVFLYITHNIPTSNWLKQRMYLIRKRQIFMQLEHCAFHRYERTVATVLTELTNVSQSDVRTWARTIAQEFFEGDLATLMAKIRAVFGEAKTLPMEPLAFKLKEILISSSGDQEARV